MKKVLLWIGAVLLTPILLFVILAVLLYVPPVQNWAVSKVVAYASEQTGLLISVERVKLVFPLDLGVDGLRVVKPGSSSSQSGDTVADVRRLVVDLRLMPLFKQKVVIDELEFNDTKINTTDFIASAHVRGTLGRLVVRSRGIDLGRQTVEIDDARLSDAQMMVELSDTVPPDTTESQTRWQIRADRVEIERSGVALHMPGDSLRLTAYMGKATAEAATVDLGEALYSVGRFSLAGGALTYDNRFEPAVVGLDPNHVALSDVAVGMDSIYYGAPEMRLRLRQFSLREKSGIEVTQMTGDATLDARQARLSGLILQTPDSKLEADMTADINALDSAGTGRVSLRLMASVGKQDVMKLCGSLPQGFIRRYPNHPIMLRANVGGNMRHLDITGVQLSLPTALRLTASGYAENPADTKAMKADVRLKAQTGDLGFLTTLLGNGAAGNYRIPSGIALDGHLTAAGTRYGVNLTAREGKGTVALDGHLDASAMSYRANLDIQQLNLRHFMPKDSLRQLTAHASINGRGTDLLSRHTRVELEGGVDRLGYGSLRLGNIEAKALVRDGMGHVNINSRNSIVDGTISVDALLSTKKIAATIGTDLRKADLYRMRITEKPVTAAMCAHVDIASDMRKFYMAKGSLSDMTVKTEKKTYRPPDVELDMMTRADTTWASVTSSDMALRMTAGSGYEELMEQGLRLKDEALAQFRNKIIDQPRLRELLPDMNFRLTSGDDNSFANFLRYNGVSFDKLFIDVNTSPLTGLNGDLHLFSLIADSTKIDTVRFHVYQDSTNIRFNGIVQNNKKNPQFVFKTLFEGSLLERGTELSMRYYDGADRLGVYLGTKAEMCDSGIRVRLIPEQPVLGYKQFNLNKDNFIFLGRNKRIEASVDLVASDGTGIKVYSEDQDPNMLQDLTVSLNQFDLEKITSVLPYAPRVSGLLNGDFHVMQDHDERLSAVSDMYISGLTYEKCPMGNIGTEFAYLQKEDSTHFVEASLVCDGREIGVLSGTYKDADGGYLDATFDMSRFPLAMANGFIPDRLFGLVGYAEGTVDVKGPLSRPLVDGELMLDSSYISSVPYGVELRFDNDPVRVVGSNLLFENFTMYAHNDNPLNISGNIDFSNFDNITMDVRMRARDYQLIDAKQTRGSVAYGKAFVNFFGSLRGTFDNLVMRGQLDVLGKTDMTYILKDSPLNTDDRLKDLVTFTDFHDTTKVEVSRPEIGGLDMVLMMNIEQGAHIFCALNADQSNYVSLEGGGELRMVYNQADDMQLFGRYTINDGEMKYALPIIPLKTFTIEEGSYIEFTGDMMNPRLNLTATEQVRTLVASETAGSRSVLFNCGVKVTKTLNDMGLEFTLSAPEDMTMTNELATMSTEDRGKLAVTMLTTGMYLADGNTGGFSMNSALNSFLQSEINNITSSAMRTIDLSVGLDQNSDATGNTYTDYSFKFAKRFWNNRVNFIIGGKLSDNSSDAAAADQDQTFIDNVSLEYRIDQTAMRYVRLFYNKEANDLLEGRVSEYGAGFVWRKKADRFWQLFNFRSNDNKGRAPGRLPSGQTPGQAGAGQQATQVVEQSEKTDSIKANEDNKQ